MENLINLMEVRGFYYDDFESYEGNLRFIYTGQCFPLQFESWAEVKQWLAETEDLYWA